MKNFEVPHILGGEDPIESSNFGLKIEFFISSHQKLSMLQSVRNITSYALDFQHVSFTYVLITTDQKSIQERSLANLSNISMTMVVILVKICIFTLWKIICHFQRPPVSFVRTTGF